jgi:hypothetical protein
MSKSSDKMIIDIPTEKKGAGSIGVPITPVHCTTLNLTQYITRYKGQTKLMRLNSIADKCPELRIEALRLLIDELKKGVNTTLYASICQFSNGSLGADYDFGQYYYYYYSYYSYYYYYYYYYSYHYYNYYYYYYY